jgi:hypothetical protein
VHEREHELVRGAALAAVEGDDAQELEPPCEPMPAVVVGSLGKFRDLLKVNIVC